MRSCRSRLPRTCSAATRPTNHHLAFGRGIYFYLGAPLARAEARIAFSQLRAGFATLELVSDVPRWGGDTFLRGLITLPVRW